MGLIIEKLWACFVQINKKMNFLNLDKVKKSVWGWEILKGKEELKLGNLS